MSKSKPVILVAMRFHVGVFFFVLEKYFKLSYSYYMSSFCYYKGQLKTSSKLYTCYRIICYC